jgi:hypothetical protein
MLEEIAIITSNPMSGSNKILFFTFRLIQENACGLE